MSTPYPPAPGGTPAPQQPVQPTPPGYGPPQGNNTRGKNVLGLVAMVIALVGFVFACLPGALILGWILLPIAFILGIVAVCLKGSKWQAITAIVVSVVGTVVAVVVFLAVVATSVNETFGSGDTSVSETTAPDEQSAEATGAPDQSQSSAAAGTRENPAALGSEIANDDWKVTINSVTSGEAAAEQLTSANQFNEPADDGTEYIIINYTVTYVGDDSNGELPAMVGIDYVTKAGATVDSTNKLVVAPDSMDSLSTLYNGGSATGNTAIQVPSPVDGVLAVRPGMFADTVFVAVQ